MGEAIAFDSEGKHVLIGSGSWIKLWNIASRSLCHKLNVGNDSISSVSFCPQDSILVARTIHGQIHLWDKKTGKSKEIINLVHRIMSAVISHDNSSLMISRQREGSDKWSLQTDDVQTLEFSELETAASSNDGSLVALGAG